MCIKFDFMCLVTGKKTSKIFILFQAYSFSVSSTAVGGKNQQFSVKYYIREALNIRIRGQT